MARKLEVTIVGDSRSLERAFGNSSRAAESFGAKIKNVGRGMESTGKMLTTHLTLPIVGLGVVMGRMALESQVSMAKFDAAVRSSGLSLKEMTPALEGAQVAGRKLGFTNIDVQAGLAKLVVATQDGKTAIADLTTAEDLARFKHISLAQSSQMLSQAMTGSARAVKQLGINVIPVTTAVNALKEAHKASKQPITEAELATAKLADKQATGAKIIDIVTQRLHGQAAAFAETAAGGMARFRAQIENIGEKLGSALLPMLNKLVGYLERALNWFNNLSDGTKQWIGIAAGVAAAIGPLVGLIGSVTVAVGGLTTAVMFLAANPVVLLLSAVTALSAAMILATTNGRQMSDMLQRLGVSASTANGVVTGLQAAFTALKTIVNAAIAPFRLLFETIIRSGTAMVQMFNALIHGQWSAAWNDFKNLALAPVRAMISVLSSIIPNIASIVRGAVGSAGAAASAVGNAILNGIKRGVSAIRQVVAGALGKVYDAIQMVADQAIGWASSIGSGIIAGIISGLGSLISQVASAIIDKVKSAIGDAINALTGSPHVTAAIPIGTGIGAGVAKGVTDSMGMVSAAISTMVKGAIETLKANLLAARGEVSSAFGGLASAAKSAFDATHGGSTKAGDAASAALAKMQAEDQVKQLNDALASAIASGDQAQIDAANRAIQEHDLQVQIAAEQAKHDALVKKQKDDFEKRLAELQKQAGSATTEKQVQAIQEKIKALFAKYGLTFKSVEAAGDFDAAASLFTGAMGDLNKSMRDLIAALDKLGSLPKRQHGGYLPGEGGIPIMAHGGEYVVRKKAVDKLGLGFMNSLNRYDEGGVVHPWQLDDAYIDPGYLGILQDREARAKAKYGGASIFNPRNWTPDIVNTAGKYQAMLTGRYGSDIHFEDGWIPEIYNAVQKSAGIIESALAAPPDNIWDRTHGTVWYDLGQGRGRKPAIPSRLGRASGGLIPSFAMGGVMPHTGLAYLHRGETVTPAGGTPVVNVYIGDEQIAARVESKIVERGRRGGALQARTPS